LPKGDSYHSFYKQNPKKKTKKFSRKRFRRPNIPAKQKLFSYLLKNTRLPAGL